MTTFQKVKLGDVTEISSGGTPSSSNPNFWSDVGINWATLPDLRNKYLFDTQRKITQLGLKNSSAKLLPINSVIFSSRATIGEVSITKVETCTNQGSKNFICKPEKISSEFLYYSLKQNAKRIEKLASGATYKEINKTDLSNVEINLPPLIIQQKIASILSAYDDLIENNNKRIKILEEIAQSVYKDWFIAKKSSEWKEVAVNEIANVYRGKSYKGSELSETVGVPFITIKCINRGGGFRFDGLKLFNGQAKESNTVKPGDIVIAVTDMTQERMIVARPARIPKLKTSNPFVFSMDLVKVLAKDNNYQNFLYGFFMYSGFGDLVKNYANGVNVLHLSQDHIANARLLLPKKSLIEKYDNVVSPIYQEMDNLQLKNEILLKTKNLLLPKIISGELDVEELDIKIRPEIL